MASVENYAAMPHAMRLARLARTPDELARAIVGRDTAELTRRPAPAAWAPVEILAHLRDSDEWFLTRCRMILLMDEPRFPRTNPERWAVDRQYLRNDAAAVVYAFRRWREELRGFFIALPADAWSRGGIHLDGRGRRTLEEFLSVIAWHDDNHADQLARALEGLP